ncbi:MULTISPECIES: selenide, water dikinase SelD [Aphanothece]|uniref:selenide, water dikinase SelD n=1 Tax=Aphanothece TaxID=1121 RepID=UPI0039854843
MPLPAMHRSGPTGHLVLAGGGHTHALVLNQWAMGRRPKPPAALVSLVSRHGSALYSGMVPGIVAGIYGRDAGAIDLRQLCQRAGVSFLQAEITGLDAAGRTLQLAGRPALPWDWLSLDVGAITAAPGGAMAVKPLEPFLTWVESRTDRAPVRIRGGGAAAVELALALRRRGRPVTLLLRGENLHLGSRAANRLGERLLGEAGIGIRRRAPETEPAELACTGSRAPGWLGAAGLPTDGAGRLRTEPSLRVEGQERIFACGDCAVITTAPRPPSGVWAVRAAPTLARNLARSLAAQPDTPPTRLSSWKPQRWALQLLGDAGKGTGLSPAADASPGGARSLRQPGAMALWGPLAVGPSPWLWRWKDSIDRRFMARFLPRHGMDGDAPSMACRGCAAKLPAAPLMAALAQSGGPTAAEDAAVVAEDADGTLLLQSVDGFPALVSDPWLNARLTTLHACSDLWACGARVLSAQALVTLPQTTPDLQQELLRQTLEGIRSVLGELGAPLIGGHTLEARDGAGLSVALSVNGRAQAGESWPKGPLTPGDALVLSRPLGTGVLFAAAMAGMARADWIDQALEQMQRSQAPLVDLLRHHGCRACTDITGFGLLGHLGEMLAASPPSVAVQLDGAALPALTGALQLLEAGQASTLASSNATALALLESRVQVLCGREPAQLGLLIDPQTCGPLLAALPAEAAAAAVLSLRDAGFAAATVVGRVLEE